MQDKLITPQHKKELAIRLLESGLLEEYEETIVRLGNCEENRYKLFSLVEFKMFLQKKALER